MKSTHALLAVAALASLALGGCAAPAGGQQQDDGFSDLQTRTGSNMLVRTARAPAASKKDDKDGAKNMLQEMRDMAEQVPNDTLTKPTQ